MRCLIRSCLVAALLLGVSQARAQTASQVEIKGKIRADVFLNIGGTAITALTGNPKFPDNPDEVHFLDIFEFPPGAPDGTPPAGNVMDNYGTRMWGWITPTRTSSYVFYLAADDQAQLWLSTDDKPENRVLIANEPQWNPVRAWDSSARRPGCPDNGGQRCNNVSAPVRLEANKKYFIEALNKEGGGGDNLAVTWIEEGGIPPVAGDPPLSAANLLTAAADAQVQFKGHPQGAKREVGATAKFSARINAVQNPQYQWLKNGQAIAGATSINYETPALVAGDNGAKYKLRVTSGASTAESNEATLTVVPRAREVTQGFLRAEVFTGISGVNLDANLRVEQKYIDNKPDSVEFVSLFEYPPGTPSSPPGADIMNNYGVRLTGFIVPQETATYIFNIAADDNGELYLSTNESPANEVLIASEPQWNPVRAFANTDRRPNCPDFCENISGPIRLEAGKRYWVRAEMKEGGGGDNLAVAWRKDSEPPIKNGASPITGAFLATEFNPNLAEDVTITQQPVSANAIEGNSVAFSVKASSNVAIAYQWQKAAPGSSDFKDIRGAADATYKTPLLAVSDNGSKYRVRVSVLGKSVNSSDVALTVVPDTFPPVPIAAALKKGDLQEIGISFDEPIDVASATVAANYSLSAGKIDKFEVVTRSTDNFSPDLPFQVPQYSGVKLIASGLTPGQEYSVSVKGVKDLKGNTITTPVNAKFKAEGKLTWAVVGAAEAKFKDDVVRVGDEGFDVISGGVGFWADYDEMTFVYEEITGDFDKAVQLEYQDPSSQWARTGLMAREALDAGKARPERADCTASVFEDGTPCVPKAQWFSRLQTVHANAAIRWDAGTSNNGYENHFRNDEQYRAAFGNHLNSADGGFGPLDYPNVWMRLARKGNTLQTFRSKDGVTWNAMTSREFKDLKPTLFVGPFYGPELANNGTRDGLGHSVLAKFRNYRNFSAAAPPTRINFERTATGIRLTYQGTLQSADNVAGPYTDVTGAASPTDVSFTGAGKFYRVRR